MQRQILTAVLYLLTALTACRPPSQPAVTPTPEPTTQPTPQSTTQPTIQPTTQPIPTPFNPPDLLYLAAAIEQALADFDGVSSYVILDLETGDRIGRDEDVAIAGMSLLKIPILVETYRVLDRPPDVEQTKLITQTTALSSNFAANLLLDTIAGGRGLFAGADILTESMRRLGLYNTFIAVPFDQEPQPGRLSTYLTPANQRTDLTTHADPYRQTTIGDLVRLLQMIYDCAQNDSGELRQLYADDLTPAECREILQMMRLNELARLLEAGLPEDTPFSHKVGWIDDTYGNVGIVFSPERDYLIGLALYTPIWLEWSTASPLFTEISRLAYAHFNDPEAYPKDVLAAAPAVSPTTTPLPTPDLPQAIVFGTQGIGLTLRDAPAGREITILPEGTVITLLEEEPIDHNGVTWHYVRTPTGEQGWVGANFLVSD